ncbi:MAG: DUF3102 domain-containing protein [Comamonadaceae bacterium]|nr:DUF3102 domain-containing protein [Comamonadaceae bacterium]
MNWSFFKASHSERQKSECPGGTGQIADQITNTRILPPAEKIGKSEIADQINAAHQQAIAHADKAIEFAKQAGDLLLEVKAGLSHGEFLPWVKNNLEVTPRQAQRYMAAAQKKPKPIGADKCETVSHLAPLSNKWAELRAAVSDLSKAQTAHFVGLRALGGMLLELEEQFDASDQEFVAAAAEKLGKPELDIEFCMRLATDFSFVKVEKRDDREESETSEGGTA